MLTDENVFTTFRQEQTVFTDGSFKAATKPAGPNMSTLSASKGEEALLAMSGHGSGFKSGIVRSFNAENPLVFFSAASEAPLVLSADGTKVIVLTRTPSTGVYRVLVFDPFNQEFLTSSDPAQATMIVSLRADSFSFTVGTVAISVDGRYVYAMGTGIHVVDLSVGTDLTVTPPDFVNRYAQNDLFPALVASADNYLYYVGQSPAPGGATMGPWELIKANHLAQPIGRATLGENTGVYGCALDVSQDGKQLALVEFFTNTMSVYDTASMTVRWSIAWGKGQAVFSLDGERLYAVRHLGGDNPGRKLTVIKAATGEVISEHTEPGSYALAVAVGRRMDHRYLKGFVCDSFGGEMISDDAGDIKPPGPLSRTHTKVQVQYAGPPVTPRRTRGIISGYKKSCLYHRDGLRGGQFGLCAQNIETKQWDIFYSKDYGWTWEKSRMLWDETFIYSDVCGTVNGLELSAAIKSTFVPGSGGLPFTPDRNQLDLYVKHSTGPDSWSEPVLIANTFVSGPVAIRPKVECNSSIIVLYAGSGRWESSDLFQTFTKTS